MICFYQLISRRTVRGTLHDSWCTLHLSPCFQVYMLFFLLLVELPYWYDSVCCLYYRPQRSWDKVIFSEACVNNSVHRRGMCGCTGGGMHGFIWGGMHGFIRGACVVFLGGMCGFIWGACVVLFRGCVWFYLGGVHGFIGGHAWFYSGGMCGFIWGACMVLFGGRAWFYFGGHAWFYFRGGMCGFIPGGGMHGFIREGVRGFISGGGIHGFILGGWHAWFFRIQWDTVNERAVRILLECILVTQLVDQPFLCLPY